MRLSRTLGWLSYQAAMAASLVAYTPVLATRRGFGHYRPTLRGRLGLDYETPNAAARVGGRLWVHAVSVGEVGVAATLIRCLDPNLPVVITTVTPTGQAHAHRLLGERCEVAYLPFDLGAPITRFLDRFDPRALILVEGDYWPLLLSRLACRDCPVVVVNGRLSDRAYKRQRRVLAVNRLFFDAVERFGVQTTQDEQRLVALGVAADRVTVTGNLKFDAPRPPRADTLISSVEELAAGRPILVAGSTMDGEEVAVLDAFVALGGGESALLVIAARHPERFDGVAELVAKRGFAHVRRSEMLVEPGVSSLAPAVLVLDTLGELAGLYEAADIAFIGGTLAATGGHNPLEAARFGVPITVGPSMFNFQEIAKYFDDTDGWEKVDDAAHLARVWRVWLDDPQAARRVGARGFAVIEENRGATEHSLSMIMPLVERMLAQ